MFDKLQEGPSRPGDGQLEEAGVIPRDGRGSPKIWLPDGSKRASYSRPSSIGSALEDKDNLIPWHGSRVAIGAMREPGILEEMSAMEARGFDWDSQDGKGLSRKFEARLFESGGGNKAADVGTFWHDVLERIDHGLDPGFIPDEFQPYVDAYTEMMDRIKAEYEFSVLGTEMFGVNDGLKIAGTMDMLALMRVGGKMQVVVVDKKTSQSLDFAQGKFVIQLWAYANMVRYDPAAALRKENKFGLGVGRSPLHTFADGVAAEVNKATGFIQHIPSGSSEAHWVPIPIQYGQQGYELAQQVKEWRNMFKRKAFCPTPTVSVIKEDGGSQ